MNWHAREGDLEGNGFKVIYHIAIPNTNNRAGVNYRTALVGSGIGGTTVMAEGTTAGLITTAEKAQITSGQLYEFVEMFDSNPGEAVGALQARIDARYNALIAIVQGRLQKVLTYWGHDRNVT